MSIRRCLTLVATALLTVLTACGVPVDDQPRAINRATTAPSTVVPTTADSPSSEDVSVYFLRDDELERLGLAADEPTLTTALGFVLGPLPDEADPGLRTAVPPGTQLLGADIVDTTARVDLTSEISDLVGELQKEAFAQIVFTALSVEPVERVRFLVDGKTIDAPTDEGNLTVVTADDYDPPLNPR